MPKLLLGVEMDDAKPLGIGTRREKRGRGVGTLRRCGDAGILMIRALKKVPLNRQKV